MSDCTHETINALDNFWAYDCPSCGRTVSGPTYVTLLREQLSTLKAQREWVSVEEAELQPGEWVEAWHKVHECSITVNLVCGSDTSSGHAEWWEKTLATSWPFEAMSHVRPLPPAPEGE